MILPSMKNRIPFFSQINAFSSIEKIQYFISCINIFIFLHQCYQCERREFREFWGRHIWRSKFFRIFCVRTTKEEKMRNCEQNSIGEYLSEEKVSSGEKWREMCYHHLFFFPFHNLFVCGQYILFDSYSSFVVEIYLFVLR